MFTLSTIFSKQVAGANRRGWSAERGQEHGAIMNAVSYQPSNKLDTHGAQGFTGGSC